MSANCVFKTRGTDATVPLDLVVHVASTVTDASQEQQFDLDIPEGVGSGLVDFIQKRTAAGAPLKPIPVPLPPEGLVDLESWAQEFVAKLQNQETFYMEVALKLGIPELFELVSAAFCLNFRKKKRPWCHIGTPAAGLHRALDYAGLPPKELLELACMSQGVVQDAIASYTPFWSSPEARAVQWNPTDEQELSFVARALELQPAGLLSAFADLNAGNTHLVDCNPAASTAASATDVALIPADASSESAGFVIPRSVASCQSGLLRDLLLASDDDELAVLPLANVANDVLRYLVAWMSQSGNTPASAAAGGGTTLNLKVDKIEAANWEMRMILEVASKPKELEDGKKAPFGMLGELINAANYLDAERVLRTCIAFLAFVAKRQKSAVRLFGSSGYSAEREIEIIMSMQHAMLLDPFTKLMESTSIKFTSIDKYLRESGPLQDAIAASGDVWSHTAFTDNDSLLPIRHHLPKHQPKIGRKAASAGLIMKMTAGGIHPLLRSSVQADPTRSVYLTADNASVLDDELWKEVENLCLNMKSAAEWIDFSNLPALTHLQVIQPPTKTDASPSPSLEPLAVLRSLQFLQLPGNPAVTDDHITSLSAMGGTLTALDVSNTGITDKALATLAKICPNLESLSIASCDTIPDAAVFALNDMAGLRFLNLNSATWLTNKVIDAFQPPLGLEVLELANCTAFDGIGLCVLASKLAAVEHLGLASTNSVLDPNCDAAITSMPSLIVLDVTGCKWVHPETKSRLEATSSIEKIFF